MHRLARGGLRLYSSALPESPLRQMWLQYTERAVGVEMKMKPDEAACQMLHVVVTVTLFIPTKKKSQNFPKLLLSVESLRGLMMLSGAKEPTSRKKRIKTITN